MKKITTKSYGIKNVLLEEELEGTNFRVAAISVDRQKKYGIIDMSGVEVVPFGEFIGVSRVRKVDENNIIVDCEFASMTAVGALKGSFFIHNDGWGYRIFKSDAAIMLANERIILGAKFKTEENIHYEVNIPTSTFEYAYKKDEVIKGREFDEDAYLNGQLQEYLLLRYLPKEYLEDYDQYKRLRYRIAVKEICDKFAIREGCQSVEGFVFKKNK